MIYARTHAYSCNVPFDFLDPGNAVYHPNYLVLCDRARSAALALAGYSVDLLWKDGIALAVRENTSEYFRPAQMGNLLTIFTQTTEVTGPSLKVCQRIVKEEGLPPGAFSRNEFVDHDPILDLKTVIHQVRLHLVCIHLVKLKPVRIPKKLIEVLNLPPKNREREDHDRD